jgi:hypothetical protein
MYDKFKRFGKTAENSFEPIISNRVSFPLFFFKQKHQLLASTSWEKYSEIG